MAELRTLARPYARAAFKYALNADNLAGWEQMLATLAGVSQHQKIRDAIDTPGLSAQEQARIIIDVCADDLDQPVQNFVEVLADKKRLPLLPELYQMFRALKTQQEQEVDVELTTAFALDDSAEEQISQALTKKLSRKINLHSSVDQSLLAGAIIKAGDLVIDGSVRGRLEKLSRAINS